MRKHVILITGPSGIGKTTAILKLVDILKEKEIDFGGMITKERRKCGTRVGFEIIDLTNLRRGWLAHINQKQGPRIGKYRVNMEHLNSIGTQAILDAVERRDVIIVDEIGPMELCSEKFKKAIEKTLLCNKLVIATIHQKATDPIIDKLKKRIDVELIILTKENREVARENILEKVKSIDNLKYLSFT